MNAYNKLFVANKDSKFPVDTKKVFLRHIISGLLSTRLQQAVLLNSIKAKREGFGSRGFS